MRLASKRTPTSTRSREDYWRHDNVGRLLNNAIRRFETRVLQMLAETGHAEARLSHLHVTRNLDIAGTRMTELGRRAGVTKQAIGELIGQCEELGLIRRTSDPLDARAKLVKFTERGLQWLAAFGSALQRAEEEMESDLGLVRMSGLKSALRAYTQSVETGRDP